MPICRGAHGPSHSGHWRCEGHPGYCFKSRSCSVAYQTPVGRRRRFIRPSVRSEMAIVSYERNADLRPATMDLSAYYLKDSVNRRAIGSRDRRSSLGAVIPGAMLPGCHCSTLVGSFDGGALPNAQTSSSPKGLLPPREPRREPSANLAASSRSGACHREISAESCRMSLRAVTLPRHNWRLRSPRLPTSRFPRGLEPRFG